MKLYFVLFQMEGLHINSKEPTQYQFQRVACNMANQSLIRSTIHVRHHLSPISVVILTSCVVSLSLWKHGIVSLGSTSRLSSKAASTDAQTTLIYFQRVLSQA